MKTLLFASLLCTLLPAHGQITVDLEITEGGAPLGTLTVEVDHVNAPMAAANFLGLVSGKLSWIDSTTGIVQINKPYYDGIIFHRIVGGFVSQFGSQKGDGSDGPGYKFPDEPDLGNLTHSGAYVLSMANSGPNTNGSQVFITATATPGLDSKHIVFGKVAATSESLADYINGVAVVDFDGPDNIDGNSDDNELPVTELKIVSATVNYNGVTFDPCAQGLPMVSAPPLTAPIGPATTELPFTQPARSLAGMSYGSNLGSWTGAPQRYLDGEASPLPSFPLPAGAISHGRQFFAPALISYGPTALFPDDLSGRTLTMLTAADPSYPFTFVFDASGVTGTWSYSNPTNPLSGDITNSFFVPDGYGGQMVMQLTGISHPYWYISRMGFDSSTPTLLSGRQNAGFAPSSAHYALGFNVISANGIFSLTR